MILVSYDISNDKLRTLFSKYLSKYGHRIQYSLFEIENSQRILDNIILGIEGRFMKKFEQTDSVYIFVLTDSCKIKRYGYAKNEEKDLFVIT